jgi:hypothetical protein
MFENLISVFLESLITEKSAGEEEKNSDILEGVAAIRVSGTFYR